MACCCCYCCFCRWLFCWCVCVWTQTSVRRAAGHTWRGKSRGHAGRREILFRRTIGRKTENRGEEKHPHQYTQTRSVAHNYTYTFLFFYCDGVRPIAQLPQNTRIIYWILLFFCFCSTLLGSFGMHFFTFFCAAAHFSYLLFLFFFLLSYLRLTFSFFAFLLSTGHVLFSAWFLSSFPVTCAALCAFLARPTEIINRTKPMWFRSFICITFLLLFYLPLMCSVFSLLFSANNSANKRKDILIHNSSFSLQPLLI